MSLVRPFRARMYRHEPGADLSDLTAPPYDVVNPEQRAALLARNDHNVVALELPDGPLDPTVPGNRYETGAETWRRWHDEGILVEDASPAIYVVEQSWKHEGTPIRRRGFISAVRLHPFSDGVVLPHERTLPKAISDRLDLTRATAANLSQVFGLFSDPAGETGALFDAATAGEPLCTSTDADGVVSRLWAIRDAAAIDAVSAIVGERQVFIADGHHRYTTALAYRDERRAADAAAGRTPIDPAYDFVMMTLVNMDDPDLLVLPTHRRARAAGAFDVEGFWRALSERFDLTPIEHSPASALEDADRSAFVVRTADGSTRLAMIKADLDPARVIEGDHSDGWKRLDVTVLQELILKPLLGIDPDVPETLDRLSFAKTVDDAFAEGADATFLLKATRMDQLRQVALAGETMPQKSTYFYPKLASGLVMRSLA
ncbi:DUF1015 domain-containing protein [Anaerosoma tenue]|uniref:DUF1015 domain-containing protein n=1 Tax=Anaerosoma tenue TaxID=2933588 RepID=UPI002260B622|nr:DUF1015 domain-containing protein [Anaerosoma tenue]MCK8114476.1 DUF1015 domain-containing protein [Anaerosoma tenue]